MDNEQYEIERHEASNQFANTVTTEIKEEAVLNDAQFVEAYKKVAAYKGKEIAGTNQEEMAREGLQFVSDMIMPLTTLENEGLAGLAQLAAKADPETKQAMAYMYNTVENKETTWNGFVRGLKSVGKDPSLYAGVATSGWGFFGREAARNVVKQKLGTMLVSGMVTSAYMGAEEIITQEVEDTYSDTPTDWTKVQEMTEMGAMFGLFAPVVMEGTAKAVGSVVKETAQGIKGVVSKAYKEGEELAMQSAGGGTPEKIKLYHGTDAEFEEFGRMGDRITSLGYGHYFSPDKNIAKQYGKNIKEIEIPSKDIINLDAPTPSQRKEIISKLDKVVPDEIKAGYGGIERIDITNMSNEESLKIFKQKKKDTDHLWHDRAKAQFVEEGDREYIQWMSPGLDGASDSNLKNLIHEYSQDIPKELGYKGASSSGEVAIYDTELVNKSIKKATK